MTAAAHVGVYGLFLGLAAAYTWPLVTDLAHLLPPNGDPRLFSWVLLTMFRNLTSRPDLLFHGNAFYPFGNTLSFAEPLLVPALVAGPVGVRGDLRGRFRASHAFVAVKGARHGVGGRGAAARCPRCGRDSSGGISGRTAGGARVDSVRPTGRPPWCGRPGGWWRRWELNPRPKIVSPRSLHP
jgi:hypothetical protein